MRTEITQSSRGVVVLSYDFVGGKRIHRCYDVLPSGVVVECDYGGGRSPVTARLALAKVSPPLTATIGTLLSVIRHEYRAMRRMEAR